MKIGVTAVVVTLAAMLAGCASTNEADPEADGRVLAGGVRGEVLGGTEYGAGMRGAGEVTTRERPDVRTEQFGLTGTMAGAWTALEETVAELELPVGLADEARGLLRIDGRLPRVDGARMSRWVDCGSTVRGETADRAYINVSVVLQLSEDPSEAGRTRLDTEFFGIAQPRDNQSARVTCRSTGRLETLLAEETQARITGA